MHQSTWRPRKKHLRKVWFSCVQFTVRLLIDPEGQIIDAAPAARKFIGQTVEHLTRWAGGPARCRVVFFPEKERGAEPEPAPQK